MFLLMKPPTIMMCSPSSSSSLSPSIFTINIIVLLLFSLVKHTNAGAYDLPAGTLKQTGLSELKRTFKCEAEGYFADVDNECKIYHQCNSFNSKKGSTNVKYAQTTMACGENQIFDQSKFACKDESDAIPCEASSDFFYLNERIGDETADFLTDADIEKAQAARPEYRAAAKRRRSALSKKRRSTRRHNQQSKPRSVIDDLHTASSNIINDKVIITSPKLLKINKPKRSSSSSRAKKSLKKSKKKAHNNRKKAKMLIIKMNR